MTPKQLRALLGPAAAKVKPKRIRLPKPVPAPVDMEPPGAVICEGEIDGRAVPWKAPRVGRSGGTIPTREHAKYKAWKAHVAANARPLMRRRRPYGGPCKLDVTFYLAPTGRTIPDRDNLVKAFADALEGVVYADDVQVCAGDSTRLVDATERQRVVFRVTAADGIGWTGGKR